MTPKQIERISKALGDPYRLKIVEAIHRDQEKGWLPCVAIVEMLDLAQSTVSHHLKQLVDADLVIAQKDGRHARYMINKEVFTDYINFLSVYN